MDDIEETLCNGADLAQAAANRGDSKGVSMAVDTLYSNAFNAYILVLQQLRELRTEIKAHPSPPKSLKAEIANRHDLIEILKDWLEDYSPFGITYDELFEKARLNADEFR